MDRSNKQTDIHELLLELDRLEELREELEERGLHSVEEIEARINDLSLQAESLEAAGDATE